MSAERARWRAPGRVNLIGEHTDYNAGLALPFAIEQTCLADVRRRGGERFRAVSVQEDQVFEGTLAEVARADDWVRYVLGAAVVLSGRGVEVPSVEVDVDSSVPTGAGLSSSAAVICAVVAALDDLLDLGLNQGEQVAVAVAVENDVVGAPTGGLDQLVSIHAHAGEALLCDFADTTAPVGHPVPLDLAGHGLTLLVVDTGVRHSHAGGEYAARRRACEQAAEQLGVEALGRLGSGDLDTALSRLDGPDAEELRRCVRHVVTEDERVRTVVGLLRDGAVEEIGPHLSASHASLRDDYRVSCPELDLAAAAMESAGALGARMTGGGFGGCAIGLVRTDQVAAVEQAVVAAYAGQGWEAPRTFTATPSEGARPAGPTAQPAPHSG